MQSEVKKKREMERTEENGKMTFTAPALELKHRTKLENLAITSSN